MTPRRGEPARLVRLRPGDEARLKVLRLRALQEAPGAFATTLDEARGWPDERWRAQLEELTTFVAVSGGIDVGLVRGQRDPDTPASAWLLSMWVSPDYRHRGIGRQLIDAVVAWARDAGCDRIVLEVSDDNTAAIACYAAQGFVPNGRTGALPAPRSHIGEHQRERRLRP